MAVSPLLKPAKGPLSPKLLKGGILTYPVNKPKQQHLIVFQYNPELLSRSIAAQYLSSEQSRGAVSQRYKAPPIETITVQIEIDASDALQSGDSLAQKVGIHPMLSALALLAYPDSQSAIDAKKSLENGSVLNIVSPPASMMTLFIWGDRRIVPVRVDGVEITEQAYDPQLNPIRATASLKMTVLTYSDFDIDTDGFNTFLAYHTSLESMANDARLATQVSAYS